MGKKSGTLKEFHRLAVARGNIYYLLSSAFLSRPSYGLVKNLLNREFLFGFSHIIDDDRGVKLLRHFQKSFRHNPKGYGALSKEYDALFLNLGTRYVTPYESAYREGMIVDDVKNMYRLARVRIPWTSRPPDHFGMELWFMYCLCNMEAKAWTKGEKELALRYLEIGEVFLERHLLRWSSEFCDEVAKLSRLSFYKGLAEITKGYIMQDYREVKELIKDAKKL